MTDEEPNILIFALRKSSLTFITAVGSNYSKMDLESTHPPLSRSPFPHKGRLIYSLFQQQVDKMHKVCFVLKYNKMIDEKRSLRIAERPSYYFSSSV